MWRKLSRISILSTLKRQGLNNWKTCNRPLIPREKNHSHSISLDRGQRTRFLKRTIFSKWYWWSWGWYWICLSVKIVNEFELAHLLYSITNITKKKLNYLGSQYRGWKRRFSKRMIFLESFGECCGFWYVVKSEFPLFNHQYHEKKKHSYWNHCIDNREHDSRREWFFWSNSNNVVEDLDTEYAQAPRLQWGSERPSWTWPLIHEKKNHSHSESLNRERKTRLLKRMIFLD